MNSPTIPYANMSPLNAWLYERQGIVEAKSTAACFTHTVKMRCGDEVTITYDTHDNKDISIHMVVGRGMDTQKMKMEVREDSDSMAIMIDEDLPNMTCLAIHLAAKKLAQLEKEADERKGVSPNARGVSPA